MRFLKARKQQQEELLRRTLQAPSPPPPPSSSVIMEEGSLQEDSLIDAQGELRGDDRRDLEEGRTRSVSFCSVTIVSRLILTLLDLCSPSLPSPASPASLAEREERQALTLPRGPATDSIASTTYSTKYVGVANGVMGILSKRRKIPKVTYLEAAHGKAKQSTLPSDLRTLYKLDPAYVETVVRKVYEGSDHDHVGSQRARGMSASASAPSGIGMGHAGVSLHQ